MLLPEPGRADHQDVVRAGGGHLQRALDVVLALHLAEVYVVAGRGAEDVLQVEAHGLKLAGAGQEGDGLGEVSDGDDVQPGHDARLARVVHRNDEAAELLLARCQRHREAAVDLAHAAVEGQLAHDGVAPPSVELHRVHRLQEAEGDGQLERGPLLAAVGGGQVDGGADGGQVVAGVAQGGAHAVNALLDARVGQAHQRGVGHLGAGDVDFDLDGVCLDAVQPHAMDFGEHPGPRASGYYPDYSTEV